MAKNPAKRQRPTAEPTTQLLLENDATASMENHQFGTLADGTVAVFENPVNDDRPSHTAAAAAAAAAIGAGVAGAGDGVQPQGNHLRATAMFPPPPIPKTMD